MIFLDWLLERKAQNLLRQRSPRWVAIKKEAKIVQHNTKICMKFSILVACLLRNKVSNKKTKLCDMMILAELQYIGVSQVFLKTQ